MLKRLNLHRDTILPYTSPDAKEPPMTLDKYLDLLARQQYLEKVKIAGQPLHGEESAAFEWRWGNREAEFSEQAASDWIIEMYVVNPPFRFQSRYSMSMLTCVV